MNRRMLLFATLAIVFGGLTAFAWVAEGMRGYSIPSGIITAVMLWETVVHWEGGDPFK